MNNNTGRLDNKSELEIIKGLTDNKFVCIVVVNY